VKDRIERCEWWDVEVSARTRWWFLRLVTESGASGYGECSDGGPVDGVASSLRAVEALVAGRRASVDRDGMLRALAALTTGASTLDERHLAATVAGAVECALDDLAAQRAGVPLWRLFAGAARTDALELYANINRGLRDRSPAGFARAAVRAVDDGFLSVKCAPFDDAPSDGQTVAAAGLARLSAMREAIGSRAELLVDVHQRLSLEAVLATVPALEALAIGWLEDAVAFDRIDGLRRLKAATRIPLAGGEQALNLDEIAPACDAGVLDIVMPDVKHAGLAGALAIARYAASRGARVSLHNPTGPIATAASLHVAAVLARPSLLEFAYDELPERGALVTPPERPRGGTLGVPPGLGLGAALDLAGTSFTMLAAARG
jgi:galactonate dehydratase